MDHGVDKTARDLSWSQLLVELGAACFNEAAQQRLGASLPFEDRESAEERQQMTREALGLSLSGHALPMQRFSVLDDLFDAVQRGATASGKQLRDVAQLISVAERLSKHVVTHANECPTLKRRYLTEPELPGLMQRIRRAVDEEGEILDAASSALQTARRALARTRRELRSRQQSLLGKYAEALSGAFFAERDGRFVLPVRSDAVQRVDGFVLGSSGSGSTLYVEPRELTQLSNQLRVDEARVHEEEEKVLRELTLGVVAQLEALRGSSAVCLDADIIRSIAEWAERHRAAPVRFVDEPVLRLKAFRHPLLLSTGEVIPNDVELEGGQCLVLSGPNAGGKTVAMKCLGLSVWMSRAGFPLPCKEESDIGWFDHVFTDIGDEQSLSRSLSTFSAHITNIAAALEHSTARSLILLDELCSGTDPDEGAALAGSVLQAFVEKGAAVCVTTHYERLKQLGANSESAFINASVGFDTVQLKPTFRLAVGVPGASSALLVAARYGIPEAVVARAREAMPREQLRQQEMLAQLEQERVRLADARALSEKEAGAALRLREQLENEKQRAHEQERLRLQKQAAALTEEVKQARSLLQQAKKLLADQKLDKELLRQVEAHISKAAGPVALDGAFTQALSADDSEQVPTSDSLVVGTSVFVPHLKAVAEVVEPPQKSNVRVQIGGLKLLVPLDKLREVKGRQSKSAIRPAPKAAKKHLSKSSAAEVSGPTPVRTSHNTCDLRGVRVEAGLEQVDAFIDDMLRTGEHAAFILHGHGTGAMKAAVREHLSSSNYVSRFEPAARDDGGDALTLFWLRD